MRTGLALAAILVLAGCAGGGAERIVAGSGRDRIGPAEFASFAASPAVELHGARPGGASDAEIAAALRLPPRFRDAPFRVTAPGPQSRNETRIVINFGQTGGVDGQALCEGRIGPGQAATGFSAAAAFCRGETSGRAALLTRSDALTPADPEFGRAMSRLIAEAAPRTEPINRFRGD
ncbi:MAG: hypothetical protein EA355_13625 [Rhodobacteraceae bacterium]|nr:MAG: hypothetical protein EA355_13625 [Paracoccaceae bacterium]